MQLVAFILDFTCCKHGELAITLGYGTDVGLGYVIFRFSSSLAGSRLCGRRAPIVKTYPKASPSILLMSILEGFAVPIQSPLINLGPVILVVTDAGQGLQDPCISKS